MFIRGRLIKAQVFAAPGDKQPVAVSIMAVFLPLPRAEFVGKDLKQLLISRPYSLIGPPPEIRRVYPLGT